MAIHNNSASPQTKFEGLTVSVGENTNIEVSRTFYYKLGSPFSSCRVTTLPISDQDSDYVKAAMFTDKYNKRMCYEICLQMQFIQPKCNCTDPSVLMGNLRGEICFKNADLDCINEFRASSEKLDLASYCGSYCPEECDTISYTTSLSSIDYPSKYLFQYCFHRLVYSI